MSSETRRKGRYTYEDLNITICQVRKCPIKGTSQEEVELNCSHFVLSNRIGDLIQGKVKQE